MSSTRQGSTMRPNSELPVQLNDHDSKDIRALLSVCSATPNAVSLEDIIHQAYRLGNESCHRALAAKERENEQKTLAEVVRRTVERAYTSTGGDVVAAAKLLGLGRSSMYRKLRTYGIHAVRYDRCPNCG